MFDTVLADERCWEGVPVDETWFDEAYLDETGLDGVVPPDEPELWSQGQPSGWLALELDQGTANPAALPDAYCRVNSHDQKPDLERQAGRLLTMCSTPGIRIDRTVTEIGSGLNGCRTKLRKLLADPKVSTIVVEHRDRLARFGVEYLEAALSAHGRRVVVLDDAERPEDLARHLTEVLTCLCARRYGPRSASRRAAAAPVAIENEPDTAPGDPS